MSAAGPAGARADRRPEPSRSLCTTCRHVRVVRSSRSTFLLCRRAASDARYPKYPPQPVLACSGHER